MLDLKRPGHALAAVCLGRLVYGVILAVGALAAPNADLPGAHLGDLPNDIGFFERIWFAVVEPWVRRDTVYFLDIATDGYSREVGTTAFQPLYPYLGKLFGGFAWPSVGLFLVSTAAAVAFVCMLARYVDEVHEVDGTAVAAAALLAPAGFCWFLLYTEGVFATLMVAALWAAHRKAWAWAAIAAALAVLTRQQGLVLSFVFAWCAWRAFGEGERPFGALVAAAAPALAFFGWSAVRVLYVDGGAGLSTDSGLFEWGRALLVSSNAQSIAPGQRFAFPWEPLIDHLGLWWAAPGDVHLLLDFVLGWGLIAALGVAWKHLTAPERIWSAGAVLLTLCYYNGVLAPYMALPRHVIIAFPLYVGVVRWLSGKSTRLYATVGVGINLMLALLFATMRWIP
jgi:hypothetical protein